jgi:predicted RNA-binding protein with PUA-like domain
MKYWLMKSEPETFGIDDLAGKRGKTEPWDGVRNYQARNFMRDDMRVGDRIFFYHSNCEVPGIVGLAEVAREAYPDHTALDPDSKYYDPRSSVDNPRWFMVDVRFVRKFDRTITLKELRENPALRDMALVQKGNRLSVMPVREREARAILAMEGKPPKVA